ncbi:hypothetical protein B0T11DRAFT_272808 [Plectosphaerella cucumerina]|uniref:Secreted protein n=1 Tax=Plectosphaerella cucumerina TaxID=40658 RepID=A0A8K0TSL4_9PEZI|nr:hypothetical protein B0T11DRAFT_272808 [Plectosphaerella cucumerina]
MCTSTLVPCLWFLPCLVWIVVVFVSPPPRSAPLCRWPWPRSPFLSQSVCPASRPQPCRGPSIVRRTYHHQPGCCWNGSLTTQPGRGGVG